MNIQKTLQEIRKTVEAEKMRGTVFENPRIEVSLPLEGEGEGTPAGAVVTVKKPSFAVREWLLSDAEQQRYLSVEDMNVTEEEVEFVLPFGEDGLRPLVDFMQALLKVAREDEKRIWSKLGEKEAKQ